MILSLRSTGGPQSPRNRREVPRDGTRTELPPEVPTSPERATVSRFYLLVGIRGVPCCGRSSLCCRHILNVVGGVLRVMRRTTFKQNFVLAMGRAHAGKRSSNIDRPLRDSLGSRPRLRSSPVPSRVRGDTFRHSRAA